MPTNSVRRAKLAARGWCVYHYAKIFLAFSGSALALVFGIYLLLSEYFVLHSEVTVWFWITLSMWEFFVKRVRIKRATEQQRGLLSSESPLVEAFPTLAETIESLCAARKIRKPRWFVELRYTPAETPEAYLHDAMFGYDIMVLNGVILSRLKPSERRAVIAHELRHMNATSNKLRWVLMALKDVCKKLWLYCSTFYLFAATTLSLFGWSIGRSLPHLSLGRAWLMAALGLVVYFGLNALSELFESIMWRADESKTDILSCLDTGDHASLIHALERLEGTAEEMQLAAERAYQSCFGEAPKRSSGPVPLWVWIIGAPLYVAYLGRAFCAYHWRLITRSHPSNAARRKTLERIFGPAPELDSFDEEGGFLFFFEIGP
ncbi:MAG: M48 family metalloprotease [Bdellovibrionota bacterium]